MSEEALYDIVFAVTGQKSQVIERLPNGGYKIVLYRTKLHKDELSKLDEELNLMGVGIAPSDSETSFLTITAYPKAEAERYLYFRSPLGPYYILWDKENRIGLTKTLLRNVTKLFYNSPHEAGKPSAKDKKAMDELKEKAQREKFPNSLLTAEDKRKIDEADII